MRRLLTFPHPVNETAARTVAAFVVALCALIPATQWMWLTVLLAYGFLARLASGPRFSLFGQLAVRVIAPRLPANPVPGPPKRFAQGVGAVLSTGAVVAYYAFGSEVVALGLIGLITVAASLESILGLCLGCTIFGWLMRSGVIPESTCDACRDVQGRFASASS